MFKPLPLVAILALTFAWVGAAGLAADPPQKNGNQLRAQDQQRKVDQSPIYGEELMTARERSRYRKQLTLLKTQEERDRFLAMHQKSMQARAKARGVTLAPPSK
jgi:hypothetical protein